MKGKFSMYDENRILRNIEKLGDEYCKIHLSVDTRELETNWWSALKFLFNRSFMRGRRDELSDAYCRFAIEVLEDYFSVGSESLGKVYTRLKQREQLFDKQLILDFKKVNHIGKGNSVKHGSFRSKVAAKNELIDKLVTRRKIEKTLGNQSGSKLVLLGNDEDIMMVLDVLRFISDDNEGNIYRYLKETIANKGAKEAYHELQSIRAISDKLATFIIRDIGLLNPEIIKIVDYEYAFPVDTWVGKVSEKLGCEREDIPGIKQFFIEKCKDFGICPLKIAAGLWFLGFNSLDVAIKHYVVDKEVTVGC